MSAYCCPLPLDLKQRPVLALAKALPVDRKTPRQDCQSLGVLAIIRTRCYRSADRIQVLALPSVGPGGRGACHAILNGRKSFFQARRYRTRRLTREPAPQRSKDREAPGNACRPSVATSSSLFAPHRLYSVLPEEFSRSPVHDANPAAAESGPFHQRCHHQCCTGLSNHPFCAPPPASLSRQFCGF